ncbi:MAG: U32 family peptidase [Bacteroidales bacterium]
MSENNLKKAQSLQEVALFCEKLREIELLAPAGNLSIAKAAISCGADAVYMGGPQFGARYKAGNSWQDLQQAVQYAHVYGAKMYLTLNTVLFDAELPQALDMAQRAYDIGIDALIIQDLGLLACDLPPIALHASTQCHIDSIDKAQFLASVGFKRLILARELSVNQVSKIAHSMEAEVETFIHGALCVSYSGQCYLSCDMQGRSGNRGECAQACRLPYTLENASGKILCRDKYLLSMKDLNASLWLLQLMQAGVKSFKIEGRLKDEVYVKNVVSFYRQKIDDLLCEKIDYKRASDGNTFFYFEPNIEKSFHREYTDLFLDEQRKELVCLQTPKAVGECVGEVESVLSDSYGSVLVVKANKTMQAGDGLFYMKENGESDGFGLNKVEKGLSITRLYTPKRVSIDRGTILYRNEDREFEKKVRGEITKRKIPINMVFGFLQKEECYFLQVQDERGLQAKFIFDFGEKKYEIALDTNTAKEHFEKQMSKMGNTFPFIPISEQNAARRAVLEKLTEKRIKYFTPVDVPYTDLTHMDKQGNQELKVLDYRANITNNKAEEFYRLHGMKSVEKGFELLSKEQQKGKVLMVCKHCIKYQMKRCPKYFSPDVDFEQPLFISYKRNKFALHFDCAHCRMEIYRNTNV